MMKVGVKVEKIVLNEFCVGDVGVVIGYEF